MVILVETYKLEYERYWIVGHPATRYRVIDILACWEEWVVVDFWCCLRMGDIS